MNHNPGLLATLKSSLAALLLLASCTLQAQSIDPQNYDCNNYFDDGKSGTFTAQASREGDMIYGLYDHYTKEPATFTKVQSKPDGTAITDADIDGVMLRKKGNFYFLRNAPYEINIKWYGASGTGTSYDNAAIDKCFQFITAWGGGTVNFPKGTYRLNADMKPAGETEFVVALPANITVKAYNATFTSVGNYCFRTVNDNTRWYGGTIIRGRMEIRSNNVRIQNVRIEYSWNHSFHLSGGKSNDPAVYNRTYHNIDLINCTSYRSKRHGFAIHHGAYTFTKGVDTLYLGNWEHVKFINCQAIEPSYNDNGTFSSKYDYAFGMEDCRTVNDVLFQNCVAYKAPSSGWHVENHVSTSNIMFRDCVADSNGRLHDGYPYGFMYKGGYTFINCKSRDNYKGSFVHTAAFDGGDYSFYNCQVDDFKPFTYRKGIDQRSYELDPEAGGALVGTLAYVKGAPGLPMKALGHDIFEYDSATVKEYVNGKEQAVTLPYIYNKAVVFTDANRETSIASQPISINAGSKYKVSITAKELSGTTGCIYLYVQEYDEDSKIINRLGAQHFLFKVPLLDIGKDKFKTVEYTFGKGITIPAVTDIQSWDKSLSFSEGTKWIRVTLVLADAADYNKTFAINKFTVMPVAD